MIFSLARLVLPALILFANGIVSKQALCSLCADGSNPPIHVANVDLGLSRSNSLGGYNLKCGTTQAFIESNGILEDSSSSNSFAYTDCDLIRFAGVQRCECPDTGIHTCTLCVNGGDGNHDAKPLDLRLRSTEFIPDDGLTCETSPVFIQNNSIPVRDFLVDSDGSFVFFSIQDSDCAKLRFAGIERCGCVDNRTYYTCPLCEVGGGFFDSFRNFSFATGGNTCYDEAVSLTSLSELEQSKCLTHQATTGKYCGCENTFSRSQLACPLCADGISIPDPSKIFNGQKCGSYEFWAQTKWDIENINGETHSECYDNKKMIENCCDIPTESPSLSPVSGDSEDDHETKTPFQVRGVMTKKGMKSSKKTKEGMKIPGNETTPSRGVSKKVVQNIETKKGMKKNTAAKTGMKTHQTKREKTTRMGAHKLF